MFALMPWTRRNALLPRIDSPFARIPEEFGTMFDRLMNFWPEVEVPEWPKGWDLSTEENEKEFVVRFELPGFELAEVNVEVIGDRLTVVAEHKEPAAAKPEERTERTRVRRMLTLPPGTDQDRVEASYRNGILEVHIPRVPQEVGRRIEVKT
jgi:HSP20 family protein